MPESKSRKRDDYTPPPAKSTMTPKKIRSTRWIAPVMSACFIIGLLWIVAFYIAGSQIPFMKTVGGTYNALVNVGIGFGFIAVGFGLATRWK